MKSDSTKTKKIVFSFVIIAASFLFAVVHPSADPSAASQGAAQNVTRPPHRSPAALGEPLLHDPIWVYNDWSSYDELSDNIPLTEELAMKELRQILRLRQFGVHSITT